MPETTPLTPFPVLEFPPEIRNRIWRYAVVKDGDVMISLYRRQGSMESLAQSPSLSGNEPQGHKEDDEQRMKPTPLALALTSRQLYLEATLIYYSENTFTFEGQWFDLDSMLKEFIAAITPSNASSITAASFRATDNRIERLYCQIDPFLSVLPGLKQITINVPQGARDVPLCNVSGTPLVDACAQSHPSAVIKISEYDEEGLFEAIHGKNLAIHGESFHFAMDRGDFTRYGITVLQST